MFVHLMHANYNGRQKEDKCKLLVDISFFLNLSFRVDIC